MCLFITSATASQSYSSINSPWLRYQTHSLSEQVINVPDIEWQEAISNQLFSVDTKNGVIGWYKTSFKWSKTFNHPALYIKNVHHSDEIWLNGKMIGGLGQLHQAWEFDKIAPHNQYRLYKLNKRLLKNNNQLIIKINLGFGEVNSALYPGGIGFSVDDIAIVEYEKFANVTHQQQLSEVVIDAIVLALGIVDVFLILFLFRRSIHSFPEFKWLLISSTIMLSGVLGVDLLYLLNSSFPYQKWLFIFFMIPVPMLTMMYFASIHQFKREKQLFYFSMLITLIGMLTLIPQLSVEIKNWCWFIWGNAAKGFYFFALCCAIKSVLDKRDGAVSGLLGLLIYIVSIRTQWLPSDLFEHRNIIFGTLFFRYALLFSYIQRINKMSVNYKALSLNSLNLIEEQRNMMARELHDGLGQHLMASKLQLQLAHSSNNKQHLDLVKSEIDNAILLTRQLIKGLHPFNLDNSNIDELITQEVNRLESLYRIKIDIELTYQHIPMTHWVHVIRIIQESITNAYQHGKANQIKVRTKTLGNKIKLYIDDDGCGIKHANDTSEGGFGMTSLAERVAILNGIIAFSRSRLGGLRITIEFPLIKFN